jgi:hypothetical protein
MKKGEQNMSLLNQLYIEFQSLETIPQKIVWLQNSDIQKQLSNYNINIQNLISHWTNLQK